MIFLILYIHHSLRVSKDVLIISHLGTEAISAIKIWLVLPISMLFTLLYIKLSDIFTRTRLFHIMNWFFISYFILFATVLYPHREILTLDIPSFIIVKFPALKYLFKIISNWHYCLFFVFSELLITTMLSISFWQTANHITTIEESKRFYPLFGFSSQFGLMLAGYLAKVFVENSTNWQSTLNKVTTSVVIASFLLSLNMIALSKIIGIKFLNSRTNLDTATTEKKIKISLKDSLKCIITSKPILLITSLILCYNVSLNLIEGIWKKATEILYAGDTNQIHHFMGNINFYESLLCMTTALLGVYILRTYRWKTSALLTPVVIIIIGGLFFLFMFFRDSALLTAMAIPALNIAVYSGAAYYIFAKSMKHSMFDATKEMAYIPLSDELKTKGKAAAEMVGIRLGKGSGAFIQQLLLMTFTSMTLLDFAPIVFVLFIILMFCWVASIGTLNRTINK
jgi:ATP:ADP antiporter, AAA family